MPASDVLSPIDVQEFRELIVDLAFPDPYEVLRPVTTTDQFNNPVDGTPAAVEVGMCALRSGGLQPNERVIAERLGWETPYAVDLPHASIVTTRDQIKVGERILEIGGVLDEGRWALTKTVIAKEVG